MNPTSPAPNARAIPGPRDVLRRTGPRVARDGFGPLAAFYAGWKLADLSVGIAAAVALVVVLYTYERRRERPAVVVRMALGLVAIRACVGLATGSARTYLGQEIAIDLLLAGAFGLSVLVGRPLTALLAAEIYPLPDDLRGEPAYRRTMRILGVIWASYFFLRALVRAAAFVLLGSDLYVLVVALSDVPVLIGLLAWSVAFTVRKLRSEPVFIALAAPN